jgi:hypothetical protein
LYAPAEMRFFKICRPKGKGVDDIQDYAKHLRLWGEFRHDSFTLVAIAVH